MFLTMGSAFVLQPRSAAAFHAGLMGDLERLRLPARLNGRSRSSTLRGDETHCTHDPACDSDAARSPAD